MIKTYYRSEYSDKQWQALINKATELGCQVTFYASNAGFVSIDSTKLENSLCRSYPNEVSSVRGRWGERIHQMLQESTNLRKWRVQPKKYRPGYCPTICNSQESAEREWERLERITGFAWKITMIPE